MLPSDSRTAEVRQALATVNDPELDESVVDLGFIVEARVDGDSVSVAFRLPTFWCSAGFAWIMAEDMRVALGRLGWVKQTDTRLVDHFAADQINAGVAGGRGFREAFGAEAMGDLTALRETFRRKAYLGRMAALISLLRKSGRADDEIALMPVSTLRALPADLASAAARFLELRALYGGPSAEADHAFRTPEGEPVAAGGLAEYLRAIRMTRRSAEANGEMCRILLASRNDARVPELAGR